jgi:hypothetical protein
VQDKPAARAGAGAGLGRLERTGCVRAADAAGVVGHGVDDAGQLLVEQQLAQPVPGGRGDGVDPVGAV